MKSYYNQKDVRNLENILNLDDIEAILELIKGDDSKVGLWLKLYDLQQSIYNLIEN